MKNVSAVSGMFSMNIQTVVLIIVIALLKSCGIDWLIICLSVSVSFVYMDMISPCAWVSKYLIGSCSIFVNIESRNVFSIPCVTLTMIRL